MKLFRGEYEGQPRLDVAVLRRYTLLLLRECPDDAVAFLRQSVSACRTNAELVRLRGAIFECMALHVGEGEARDRIASFDLTV